MIILGFDLVYLVTPPEFRVGSIGLERKGYGFKDVFGICMSPLKLQGMVFPIFIFQGFVLLYHIHIVNFSFKFGFGLMNRFFIIFLFTCN